MALNESSKDKKSKLYLFGMILLLFLVNVLLIYKLVSKDDQLKISETALEDTKKEKQELETLQEELELKLAEFEGKNSRLDSIIQLRDATIQAQVSKLRQRLNAGNLTKAELAEARTQIESLRTQIESLTAEVEALSKENLYLKDDIYVKEKMLEVKSKAIEEKDEEIVSLSKDKKIGEQIMLRELTAIPMRKAVIGDFKPSSKLNKVDKIDVKYKLANNNLAPDGERTLYFQLISPTSAVIHSSASGSGKFNYDGGERLYTVKKMVNFTNKNESGSFSVDKTEGMTAGTYVLKVYSESHQMGATKFVLN